MASRSEFSAQTLSVLAALCQEPSQWQHGYALAKQTGLKSGTLYPILIRLATAWSRRAGRTSRLPPTRRHLQADDCRGWPARRALAARPDGRREAAAAQQPTGKLWGPRSGLPHLVRWLDDAMNRLEFAGVG